jgi:hypothetical protein
VCFFDDGEQVSHAGSGKGWQRAGQEQPTPSADRATFRKSESERISMRVFIWVQFNNKSLAALFQPLN